MDASIIEGLKKEREACKQRIRFIDGLLGTYETVSNQQDILLPVTKKNSVNNDYNPEWTFGEKIIHIIEKNNRFTHSAEIIEFLKKNDLNLDYTNIRHKLSVKLSRLGKTNKLVKESVNKQLKNTFWGKLSWKEDGKIKTEYLYDQRRVMQ